MTQTQAQELFNSLQHESPTYIEEWLKRVWAGQQPVPEPFNWLGLAQIAAADARSQKNVDWAKVSILVYEWLAAHETPRSLLSGYILSAMTLRVFMIDEKGAVPGDFVLDMDQMVRWFFENLPFSFEEAERKAAVWRTLDIQEVRALRSIKSRLGNLALLVKSERLQPDQELSAWLSLRNKLP